MLIHIRYPTPATSRSEAKILLMPTWLVKIAAILSLMGLWIAMISIVQMAWGQWRQARRDNLAAAGRKAQEQSAAEEQEPAPDPKSARPGPQDQGESA